MYKCWNMELGTWSHNMNDRNESPPWVGTEFFTQVMLMTRFRTKENYFLCIGQQVCFSSLVRSMTTFSAVPLKKN